MSQFIEMFKGDFPKLSWEECLTIINGKKYDDDYQESGTYPICGSGGIMGYGERMLCPKDTVILGRKGNINSPIYMETDYWIVDTAFCLDVDRTKLHPKYFYFWCKLFDFTRYNKQGVLPSLTKNDLLKIEMPIPPMELQTKFVDIIEQSDKSGFDELKSQFIEMFGSVDNNPKSYDIKKVGDFAECFAGATPSTKIPSYWDNGNIPWMSSGEVHKGRVQDTDAKITQQGYDGCSTKMVPIHSIVVALAGQGKTRGTVAINDIELCTNQSLCAIVPNEEVNYEYLFHNLRGRYKELRSMSGDVDGRGGLNLKHIQCIKVIVPPMSEQMKFVSIARQADKSGSVLQYMIAC